MENKIRKISATAVKRCLHDLRVFSAFSFETSGISCTCLLVILPGLGFLQGIKLGQCITLGITASMFWKGWNGTQEEGFCCNSKNFLQCFGLFDAGNFSLQSLDRWFSFSQRAPNTVWVAYKETSWINAVFSIILLICFASQHAPTLSGSYLFCHLKILFISFSSTAATGKSRCAWKFQIDIVSVVDVTSPKSFTFSSDADVPPCGSAVGKKCVERKREAVVIVVIALYATIEWEKKTTKDSRKFMKRM
ncbi:uncharacterized protein LOC130775915 [Actinidia eriantha]|uniref:uncharacterized protein LOC130775915 n=1 Tax=Actinidia eriantha TaxID=165200 RepID=UPI00258A1343|nr:uncharacterized protein LOC130775915 [Actinidia eriantha]